MPQSKDQNQTTNPAEPSVVNPPVIDPAGTEPPVILPEQTAGPAVRELPVFPGTPVGIVTSADPDGPKAGTEPEPGDLQADLRAAAQRERSLREQERKVQSEQGSQAAAEYAADVEDWRYRKSPEVLGTLGQVPAPPRPAGQRMTAADVPIARPAGVTGGTSYVFTDPEIFASVAIPALVSSYTVDRTTVAADAAGRRVLRKGTVMSLIALSKKLKPRAGVEVAAGVAGHSVDCTDLDQFVDLIRGNAVLREDRLTDDGVWGAVAASVKTDFAAAFIRLQRHSG